MTEVHKAYQAISKKYPGYRFGYDRDIPTSLSVSTKSYKPSLVIHTLPDASAQEYASQYIDMLKELKHGTV